MTYPYVDTSVIIRLLTGDDLTKQQRARVLFEEVEAGSLALAAPATVIADAVYVLSSPRTYRRARAEVAALLAPLVRLPAFHVQDRLAVLAALQMYGAVPGLDFGDALIIALMQQQGEQTVYACDRDFDGVTGIRRVEP